MLKKSFRTCVYAFMLSFLLGSATFAMLAKAQIKIPKDKIKIPVKAPALPDLDRLLKEEPPITTTINDAIFDIPFLDAYDPEQSALMTFLPMTQEATYPLLPGLWGGEFESYCLRAGTHAPGGGDGYAYAPLKGPQAEIVSNILKNSVYHPEIPQRNIQYLLWAIISRSKLSDCSKETQKTARALLSQKEYDRLNGGALGKIPEPVLNAALQKLPPAARDIFQAEARLREMLTSPIAPTYEQLESVAIRFGEVLPPPDSRQIPDGRWSYDPDGFFIRYFPSSYPTTRTQIYYPENFTIETDDIGLITLITDRRGIRIQIVYDNSVEPLLFGGDGRVAGYAFKKLILTWVDRSGVAKNRNLRNTGWVLAGIPSGGGKPESSGQSPFFEAQERYKFGVKHRDDVLHLKEKLSQVDPQLKKISETSLWIVIYLGNYCEALRQAILTGTGSSEEHLDEMTADLIGLPYRVWMKGLALLANGELEVDLANDQAQKIEEYANQIMIQGPNLLTRHSPETLMADSLGGEGESLSNARELPQFKWVKSATPSWEKKTKPKKLTSSGLPEFIPNKKIAQPGNTGRQRLGQSGRKTASGNGRAAAERTREVLNWFSGGTGAASSAAGKLMGTATPYGIPKAVANNIIGRTVSMWGECIDATSMDPPRNDYTILAQPEPGTFEPIQAGGGVSRARADAVNAYLTSAVNLTATIRAARFSVERYSGAIRAGDGKWAELQLENAIRYERESGLAMLVVADRMEALLKIVKSERVPDTRITPELVESYRNLIRQEGFGPEEIAVCRALNFTDEEIEELKNRLLNIETIDESESLFALSQELAQALREFSWMWLNLPII